MAGSSSSLSGPLKAFSDNPFDFLKSNAITLVSKGVPPEYRSQDGTKFRSGKAGIKMVSTASPKIYELQFVAMKDFVTDKNVEAFVVGYKPKNGNDDVPSLDIPAKTAPEGRFLFTENLSGCSVIVTHVDGNTYRVFHDRRMDSAVLYDDVEMCVNFNDYRVGGRYLSRTGLAITCMQFKSGAWKMFLQRHAPLGDEAYVSQVEKRSAAWLEKAFNDRRTVIQNRVKADAGNLKVEKSLIDGAKDGVVRGVKFDKEAIRGWEALRDAMKRQIQKYYDDPKRNPNLKDTYDGFTRDVTDSEDIDETWIWLQVKKNKAKVHH